MSTRFIFNSLLSHPILSRLFLRIVLEVHSRTYRLVGALAPTLEPDGLHPKHRLMKYHTWFLDRLSKDWEVLDVGCGNGALTYDMKSACKSVLGIDINPQNIQYAKAKYSREGVSYICADATKFDFTHKFNAIVLSNVLEHIEKRADFLKNLYRLQDRKCPPILLLRVPLITRDWISLYKKEIGVEWRLDRTHFIEYTLEDLREELAQADLHIDTYDIQFGEFYGLLKRQ